MPCSGAMPRRPGACACAAAASPLACLAACALVLAYCLLGAFLFLALEGRAAPDAPAPELPPGSHGDELRSRAVERLWSITEDLNILYKENWTKLAARELVDFQRALARSVRGGVALGGRAGLERDPDHRWTFSGSFLYALTLITTIGHGNVTPRSAGGKLAAIAYACVGIPIVMLYLSTVGDALARHVRAAYARLRPARPPPTLAPGSPGDKRTPFQAALNLRVLSARVPCARARAPGAAGAAGALLLALYVALGALGFRASERWSLLDGCYFSFSSLATIGLGGARPGLYARSLSARAEDAAVAACCAYILVGVAVAAAAFDLLRDAARAELRALARLCAGARPVPGRDADAARVVHVAHTAHTAHEAHAVHEAHAS